MSKETIEDSDDELDDDLFNEEGDEPTGNDDELPNEDAVEEGQKENNEELPNESVEDEAQNEESQTEAQNENQSQDEQ